MNVTNRPSIVLGANGFIGTNLAQKLLSSNVKVRGFGIGDSTIENADFQWIAGDFSDQELLRTALKGCEVVYHLIDSSTPSTTPSENMPLLASNVTNTCKMLDICREEGIRKVIYVSSGGTVYGKTGNTPISEQSPTNPICAYGINKLTIEKYLSLYHHLYGLDYAVARLSNPFGPFQSVKKGQGIIGTLIANHYNGEATEIWGDGEIIRDFIYIDDVVDALIKLANYAGDNKILNIGSGRGRTINNIIQDIGEVLNPAELAISYKPQSRAVDVPANVLDISLAGKELAWEPKTDWPDALKRTCVWFNTQLT